MTSIRLFIATTILLTGVVSPSQAMAHMKADIIGAVEALFAPETAVELVADEDDAVEE